MKWSRDTNIRFMKIGSCAWTSYKLITPCHGLCMMPRSPYGFYQFMLTSTLTLYAWPKVFAIQSVDLCGLCLVLNDFSSWLLYQSCHSGITNFRRSGHSCGKWLTFEDVEKIMLFLAENQYFHHIMVAITLWV